MGLTRKDVVPSLATAGALALYALWLTGTRVVESPRAIGALIFALGWIACTSVGSRMGEVYGVDRVRRAPIWYAIVASSIGATALVAGIVVMVTGSEVALATLVTSTAALWVLATVRHALAGTSAPTPGSLRTPIHRAA